MNRRQFTSLAGLSAVAVSTTGFIRFNGTSFEGDCATTTDILGPFYRPNSPERDNLVIEGAKGEIVQLKGKVFHKDCTTPLAGAKAELWHCSADEIYDNDSEEYRYRGTTYCDDQGNYQFTTQMPVPYDAGGGNYRPAHFHLLISGAGYQSLVTQLYFTGDPYLKKDTWASAPAAKLRTLELQKDKEDTPSVLFDVVMSNQLMVEPATLERLAGTYTWEGSKRQDTFFVFNGQLWKKNALFGNSYEYLGDNTFAASGSKPPHDFKISFELLKDGGVRLQDKRVIRGKEQIRVAKKSAK